MNGRARIWGGFTLLEVMAVIALIGFVFFVALNFYTDLANASTRAANHTRGIRRASAILDRVARDIEGAMLLVKPAEMDPIAFPWIFLGESRLGGNASERLKFVTRNHNPTRTDAAETNLATVAYVVESRPDDSIALYRWSSPHLPDSLDKSFPRKDDDGSYLLAEDLHSFGFQFLGDNNELRSEWDSSTLLESSSLPLAVEIQLSLMSDWTSDGEEPPIYRRRVLIPIRPLDLAALADPNDPIFGSGHDGDKDDDDDDDDEKDKKKKNKKGNNDGDTQFTNSNCLPRTAPEGATETQKVCVGLANSAPSAPFTKQDYQYMPPECQSLVNAICR